MTSSRQDAAGGSGRRSLPEALRAAVRSADQRRRRGDEEGAEPRGAVRLLPREDRGEGEDGPRPHEAGEGPQRHLVAARSR